ncbi:NADPH--cytochrome P450 reductase-like [Panicum virgatum]|uniref:Uncharacterized protein n=1 Tax=Panicum virgatum TaxID=38727 RepID=A0A8T0PQU0_PANVG|nr:NADPH--cytochrome P450 reductase-like [Panicum virgatum]KAG2560494.1 hypothetical protein PVAP13_8KG064000 [Panicum virgatum]KAG2560495.1 hypothetical protein PVAP13_8KG064000 [Panicum virgatum]
MAEEARARYEKAVFKLVDLDDYAQEDEEYKKLKKETVVLFFLATFWYHLQFLLLQLALRSGCCPAALYQAGDDCQKN